MKSAGSRQTDVKLILARCFSQSLAFTRINKKEFVSIKNSNFFGDNEKILSKVRLVYFASFAHYEVKEYRTLYANKIFYFHSILSHQPALKLICCLLESYITLWIV